MARIVAAWIGKHVFAFAFFNDFAVFQHHHAVGNSADHGEVVADDNEGEAVFFLQAAEQFKDLLLPLDIKRAGWFIQYEDFWADNDGAGDGEALALAAGDACG